MKKFLQDWLGISWLYEQLSHISRKDDRLRMEIFREVRQECYAVQKDCRKVAENHLNSFLLQEDLVDKIVERINRKQLGK